MSVIIKHDKNLHDAVKEALCRLFSAIFDDCHSFSFSIKADSIFVVYRDCKSH